MISQATIKKHLQDLLKTDVFKLYEKEAKANDYNRIKGAPHFSIKEANTNKIYSYTITLTQDYKSLRVVENGIYDHEVGFFPISELKPKRTTRKTTRRTAKTMTKK